ncbi:DNA polymerase III subunit chi [Thalassomonas sp. M1454]|uniref:DNA polymerase III subunit chi n=1 Tax=Thalassomonas sp. M1454 TaxID=2594477 RepID=UPI00117D5AB9|nr:DNA polymerase III subunit chi [Thalassomonas sp. M1454]TRX53872.1 DNA polymerase III subunit chi [Thalassomonas sp. M1454]
MAQVTFHLMAEKTSQESVSVEEYLQIACQQAAHNYRLNKRVFIYVSDQKSAHQVDELLWAFDADSFVPHNLPGEGLKSGSPVEISWQAPTNNRNILINLTSEVPDFARQFSQIIDFVPGDEELKQLARLRYRQYQQQGFKVDTQKTTQAA